MTRQLITGIMLILRLLCSGVFVLAGVGKFDLGGNMQENFSNWGYGNLLLLGVGTLEVMGGVLLLSTKLRKVGVYMLIPVMIGASITHFRFYEELGMPLLSTGLVLILIIILIFDKKGFIK